MPYIERDGLRIHYVVEGPDSGTPVVLMHGMSSSFEANFRATGWAASLTAAGFRVIGIDARGWGLSSRIDEPALFARGAMAHDIAAILDELGLGTAHIAGYSMGAGNTLRFGLDHPERCRSLVLGGLGGIALSCAGVAPPQGEMHGRERLAAGRTMIERIYAMRPDNEVTSAPALFDALASDPIRDVGALQGISVPTLIAVGDGDTAQADFAAVALSDALLTIPGATRVVIEGRDHMSVVPDPRLHAAVLEFLMKVEANDSV